MPKRPRVIAFDVIETLISLEPLRDHFAGAGLPPSALEHWFSIGLRDAFALGAAGAYQPFETVLESAFDELFAVHKRELDEKVVKAVQAQMKSLPAQPGAAEALRTLMEAGVRLVALTNGSTSSTELHLKENGLDGYFEQILSTDDVKLSKPQPEVYRHFLTQAEVLASQAALVACHGWDLQGAASVGLITAFLEHHKPYPRVMKTPDLSAPSLPEVARLILELEL